MTEEDAAELAAMRREREQIARRMRYGWQPYAAEDMLIAREPNEGGFFASRPYHGEPFDEQRFRLVRAGWDHDHCFVCAAKIEPGDAWWAAEPPNEVGLCLECHARLLGGGPAEPGATSDQDRM
jgi:hypothetical protein